MQLSNHSKKAIQPKAATYLYVVQVQAESRAKTMYRNYSIRFVEVNRPIPASKQWSPNITCILTHVPSVYTGDAE